MKKLYLIPIFVFLCSMVSISQSIKFQDISFQKSDKLTFLLNNTACSRWYNYSQKIDSLFYIQSQYNMNYLFPDSTILANFNNSYSCTWIHKILDVFQPYGIIYNSFLSPNTLQISQNQPYTLDSMYIFGIYRRNIQSVTDTLLIQISLRTAGNYFYFANNTICTNLNTDTVKIQNINYNQSQNKFNENINWEIKIPLTQQIANDTIAYGINLIKIAPQLLVGANNFVITNMEFIPGYNWTITDTLNKKNYFQFISKDEGGNFPYYNKTDYNASYILPYTARYNLGGGWNGKYFPSFAYMNTSVCNYKYIHHMILYKIKADISMPLTLNFSDSICQNGTAQILSGGIPTGGIYKIDNIEKTSLYPDSLSLGLHTVKYVYENSCNGTSDSIERTFKILPSPSPVINPTGNVYTCTNNYINLSETSGTGISYQWQKAGVNIGGATNSTYLTSQSGQYRVILTGSNQCSKASAITGVFYNNPPNAEISGANLVEINSLHTYSVSETVGVIYDWTVFGGSIVTGNGTSEVSINWGNTVGEAWVRSILNFQNCLATDSFPVYVGNVGFQEALPNKMVIGPNPTKDVLKVYNYSESYTIEIIDILGNTVLNRKISPTIDIKELPGGVYIIKIYNSNSEIIRQQKFIKF